MVDHPADAVAVEDDAPVGAPRHVGHRGPFRPPSDRAPCRRSASSLLSTSRQRVVLLPMRVCWPIDRSMSVAISTWPPVIGSSACITRFCSSGQRPGRRRTIRAGRRLDRTHRRPIDEASETDPRNRTSAAHTGPSCRSHTRPQDHARLRRPTAATRNPARACSTATSVLFGSSAASGGTLAPAAHSPHMVVLHAALSPALVPGAFASRATRSPRPHVVPIRGAAPSARGGSRWAGPLPLEVASRAGSAW